MFLVWGIGFSRAVMVLMLFSLNFLGDGFETPFDPRMKGKGT